MTSEKAYDLQQRLDAHLNNHLFSVVPGSDLSLTTGYQAVVQLPLTVGQWRFQGQAGINPSASGGTLSYRMHAQGGLVVSAGRCTWYEIYATNQVGAADYGQMDVVITSAAAIGSGLSDRMALFSGTVTVTVPGNLGLQIALSAGAAKAIGNTTYADAWQVI